MIMNTISLICSIISLILSITVAYLAYFNRGRLHFTVPAKIGIKLYGNELILCFPIVITNTGVLSKVINRLMIQVTPFNNSNKIIFEAVFNFDQYPPGNKTVYESFSPIVIPAKSVSKNYIGFVSRNNPDHQVLKNNRYKCILSASYKKLIFRKYRMKKKAEFKIEGSYAPPIKNGKYATDDIWHFLFSEHDDPYIWNLYKEANIKPNLK